MKLFCDLNKINRKTIVITEKQEKFLQQLNEKKYYINTNIENDKEYIYPVKISVDEFEKKLGDIYAKYTDEHDYDNKPSAKNFIHKYCRYEIKTRECEELKELAKDLETVDADGENCDMIGKIRTIKNGIPYAIVRKGGDWEIPVLFMIYYDGENIRAYFPKKGNTINLDNMSAFQGSDNEEDVEYVKKQYLDAKDIHTITDKLYFDINLCIKDFEEHIKKGKKVKEEYFRPEDLLTESLLLEAELKDIYQKYYTDIPEETFWNIVKADPTYNPQKEQKMGKYGKWLLNLYRQNKLKPEDLYKATEYLTYFNKYYNKIQQKDINQYDSLPTLLNVIKPFKDAADNGEEMTTSKSDEVRKIKEDAEKFYEDDTWLVVIPHTQEAACYYGKNTEWCTAATSSYNMFNQYYNEGLLYINICKKTNKKYQFHFETCQFMDEHDEPINVPIVSNIPLTQGLIQKYVEKYGGRALILLTTIVNFFDEGENAIVGEEPYYSYIDYDGYCSIVKTEGIKIRQLNYDTLTLDNDVQYLTNGVFKYVTEEDDEEHYLVLFDAKSGKVINGMFKNAGILNSKYIIASNIIDHITHRVVYESSSMKPVYESKKGEQIKSIQQEWYNATGVFHKLVNYGDDIVVSNLILEGDNRQMFGNAYEKRLLNLATGQYIESPFQKYDLRMRLMNDNKAYLCYRSTYASNDGYIPYVIIYPDGSLSETLTENKEQKQGQKINETVSNKLQSIVTDKVKNILFEQYLIEATLDDIYTKYYSNIPQEEFWQIIKTDPTWNEQSPQKMGKYGKWLLNQYKQGKLKMEDLYKYRESLEAFHKYNRQLVKKDIMAYGDGNSLYDAVKQFIDNPDQATSKSDEVRRMKQNVEKVYEDDEWLILIPKTEEAAKYYGKGTRWCTAADNNNYFDYYSKQGPLYININKNTNEKYQFHFESEQFMDSSDTPITGVIADTIDLNQGVMDFYENIGKGYEINEKEYEDPDAEPEEEILWEGNGWQVSSYPDGDYIYIYGPGDINYEIDRYHPSLRGMNGDEETDKPLCQLLPKGAIDCLYDQLSYDEFYNMVFGTDSRVYSYIFFNNIRDKILQISRTSGNNYWDAVLYKLNEDYSFEILIHFADRGLFMTDHDKNETNRNSGFSRIWLTDPNTDKINCYEIDKNSFLFNENVDRACGFYVPNNYVFSVNDNIGYVNIMGTNQAYTIPPMQSDMEIETLAARNNLGIVKFKDVDGYGVYLLQQQKYALNELIGSWSLLEKNDNPNSMWSRSVFGILTTNKGEKHLSTYDLPKDIDNNYANAASYYPNSDLPVVLNDGQVMTRLQFWKSQGEIYNILMQEWQKYI